MLIKEGKTNIKYLLIVVVLAVIVGGITYWQYQEMQKEEFGGEISVPKKEKTCSPEHQENCDRSCETDDDCVFSCYLGCYNKHQEVIFPEPPWPTCGVFFCQCVNGKCEIINEAQEIQGIKMETLKEGIGAEAKNGDIVSVHYVGTFENGTKFDSSIDRGTPFSFTLGVSQVIKGWDLGVLGMKVGEKRKLTIPPDLAYGPGGVPGAIPPNSTLIFEVELLGINQ